MKKVHLTFLMVFTWPWFTNIPTTDHFIWVLFSPFCPRPPLDHSILSSPYLHTQSPLGQSCNCQNGAKGQPTSVAGRSVVRQNPRYYLADGNHGPVRLRPCSRFRSTQVITTRRCFRIGDWRLPVTVTQQQGAFKRCAPQLEYLPRKFTSTKFY